MDQLNRPRTRGLEASEADADANFVRAALQEPAKFVKKAHHKLRLDFGGDDDDWDDEEKLFYQQLPFDDDENEVKVTKRRRGGRRGNFRKKARVVHHDGGEEEVRKHTVPAKLAALLREELKPRIVPFNKSVIEYKQVWYKIGDIVSTQKDEITYYAQILGFHTDQFCDKYAAIQWLIPRYKLNEHDPFQPPITTESFRGAIPADDPVNMSCFRFVLRPPTHYFQAENPSTVTRAKYYLYQNRKCFFDSPSTTLTSAEQRY